MSRREWLAGPLPTDVDAALTRLEQTQGVAHVAVMPDVHLAGEVCVGTVTATRSVVLPDAVGGDIGCGMAALAFDVEADRIDAAEPAAAILRRLYERVPILRHRAADAPALPEPLRALPASEGLLARSAREAALQLGTLGRGNHFVELQRDEEGRLFLMVHSGSRGLGPAIRDHYRARASPDPRTGVLILDAESEDGAAYLGDVAWARAYARASRAEIMARVVEILGEVAGAAPLEDSLVDADHNHVERVELLGEALFVHRKGAQSARRGERGVIPGSMGTASFHVEGRGVEAALSSSSHGAGRLLARGEARRRISRRRLERETEGVWLDRRLSDRLRDEAPGAYKDIGAVMRAQRELVRVVRRLEPVLVFKGV